MVQKLWKTLFIKMTRFYEKLPRFQRNELFLVRLFSGILNAFISVYNEQKWKYTNIPPLAWNYSKCILWYTN